MMNKQELLNEVEMLKGNINRMCVCDDVEELSRMIAFANMRLGRIALHREEVLTNKESELDK